MTARLVSRIASRVVVQWPELAPALPRAEVCRPTLLEHVPAGEPARGSGTVVAVGTHAQPYTRLLEIVRQAIEDGVLWRPVRAQVGPAAWRVLGAEASPYMGREQLGQALRFAEVVVCHGGAGIISSALEFGRKPIVALAMALRADAQAYGALARVAGQQRVSAYRSARAAVMRGDRAVNSALAALGAFGYRVS
jgi:hypothetical protein